MINRIKLIYYNFTLFLCSMFLNKKNTISKLDQVSVYSLFLVIFFSLLYFLYGFYCLIKLNIRFKEMDGLINIFFLNKYYIDLDPLIKNVYYLKLKNEYIYSEELIHATMFSYFFTIFSSACLIVVLQKTIFYFYNKVLKSNLFNTNNYLNETFIYGNNFILDFIFRIISMIGSNKTLKNKDMIQIGCSILFGLFILGMLALTFLYIIYSFLFFIFNILTVSNFLYIDSNFINLILLLICSSFICLYILCYNNRKHLNRIFPKIVTKINIITNQENIQLKVNDSLKEIRKKKFLKNIK